jgi:hypothetical protein
MPITPAMYTVTLPSNYKKWYDGLKKAINESE